MHRQAVQETKGDAADRRGFAHRKQLKEGLLTWDRAIAVIGEGIMIVDAQSTEYAIVDCNPAFEQISGYTRAEVIGRPCLFLGGAGTEAASLQELQDGLRDGKPCDVVLQLYRKDGTAFWSEVTLAPVRDEREQVTHVVGVIRDVTAHRRAEEAFRKSEARFRTAFELGPAAASIVTLEEGRFLDVNKSFTRMLGYAREDVVGRTVEDVGFLVDPPTHADYAVLLREQGGFRDVEHRVHDASGDAHTILVSAALIPINGREHILSLFSDLSKQRRLEREVLRISEEEQQRIGQDLHDSLGSRLTGIAMLSQGLAAAVRDGKPVTPEDLEQIARLAGEGTEKAQALARGLNPVGLGEKSLKAALQQLAADTWTVAQTPCYFEADQSAPDLALEVKNHLYRIAQEAVTNAVKHADAEGIQVRLLRQRDTLVLTVEDDGIGLAGDAKLDAGMGLHSMRYRADLIGARLQLDASAKGGTRVRCMLPLDHAQQLLTDR